MKKVFICLALGILLMTGCSEKLNVYEKTMKEYATGYYNNSVKGTESMTSKIITVSELKTAASFKAINYDMSKLEKCTDSSYVELTINATNNEIENITYHMECEK